MCKWSFLGKKGKYLQWKVQELITRCSLKLPGQNGLYFSTQGSVQLQAVPGLSVSFQGWTETFPGICQTSQEAATQLHRAGLNRACQSPGMSQGASPGTGMSWEFVWPSGQGRAAQLSTAPWRHCYPPTQVFHHGIPSSNKPKGTSFSCSHG